MKVCGRQAGLRAFAQAFYFIRYDFVRINFVVGARCSPVEKEWGGLARNLFEELGGGRTKSHNELYRDFLASVGAGSEDDLSEPPFAAAFNRRWMRYAQRQPIRTALYAIAAYEVLDGPDYAALQHVLSTVAVGVDLTFFEVHAVAEHFELFNELLDDDLGIQGRGADFGKASRFVLGNQRAMWVDLLQFLEACEGS
jgi:hypothetical protein